jgi:lipopolysaccharide/colanic/teichoic acid biosynthesis glycosyltransferase
MQAINSVDSVKSHVSAPESPSFDTIPIASIVRSFSYRVIKRFIDIVGATVGLIILSPLFILVGAIIKMSSPGPIFYIWNVIGRGGKSLKSYKFRSLVKDADNIKAQLAAHNEMTGPVFKMKDDPRITPIGHILRKFSIDELPQLWSVLKGDMSLVGPRPAGPHEWEKYESWQRRKLSVTPGMTCLWQVMGRNHINSFEEWMRLDLEYIDHWSLWLDIKILLLTVKAVVGGTGV